MSATADDPVRRFGSAAAPGSTSHALGAAEVAWTAIMPCAIVAVAAIVLLGPPLGHLLYSPGSDALWPPGWWETTANPEPVKQGRYLLAALAPLLVVAAILASTRRDLRLRPQTVRAIAFTTYAMLLALVAVALVEQDLVFTVGRPSPAIFGLGTVAAAGALVVVALAVLRRPAVTARISELTRETRSRYAASLAIAVSFATIWLLKGIMTDRLTGDVVGLNLPYTFNDALAVLNGRTPLVDYHIIYAKLLPYPSAIVLGAFGTTAFVYTAFMAVLNGLVLLAVYAIFRLVTRSSLLALALFMPFVAVSDIDSVTIAAGVVSPMTLPAMWPMRYAGVYLLAWLIARHIDGRRPRRVWTVFFTGGLVAVNNLEFGMGAVVATAVALLCARPPRSVREALRLAASAAGGALGAIAVVCLITLVRAGEMPNPALLFEWPRIFSRLGWFSLPLPVWGLHLAIYATFAAAIVVAAVRFARTDDDRLLTSMLAWSGVFGLLAGSYFVGRPDALKVAAILSAWSFALSMLIVVCVRSLAARSWRRPTLPQLLVLFGFGLSVCSLSRLSLPQEQIARLTRSQAPPRYLRSAESFVDKHTRRGEKVAILVPMSYRIADDLGLENIAPYALMNAIVTRSQLQTLIDAVRREHVREIFTPAPGSILVQEGDAAPAQLDALVAVGFRNSAKGAGIIDFTKVESTVANREP